MVELVTLVGGPLDGRKVQWPLDGQRRPWDQMTFCYLPEEALSSMALVEGGDQHGTRPEPRRACYRIGNPNKARFLG
jgi:hypothetical protein